MNTAPTPPAVPDGHATPVVDDIAAGPRFHLSPAQAVVAVTVVVSLLLSAAVFLMSGIRTQAQDQIADELGAKHDATFVPGEHVDGRLQEWTVDGGRHVCKVTAAALLCLDGSVYER